MRRMYSESQLIKLIKQHGGGGGSLTPEALAEILKGSEYINVDVSESGTEVDVRVDEDLLSIIAGKQEALPTDEPSGFYKWSEGRGDIFLDTTTYQPFIDDENPIGASSVTYDDDHDVMQMIDIFKTRVPAAPNQEGTYVLKCDVDISGNPTYSWVLESH